MTAEDLNDALKRYVEPFPSGVRLRAYLLRSHEECEQDPIWQAIQSLVADVERFVREESELRAECREGALDSRLIRHVEGRHLWVRKPSRVWLVRLYRWYCASKGHPLSL